MTGSLENFRAVVEQDGPGLAQLGKAAWPGPTWHRFSLAVLYAKREEERSLLSPILRIGPALPPLWCRALSTFGYYAKTLVFVSPMLSTALYKATQDLCHSCATA